ncbi:MAG: DUF222 domain-containing protein [Microbacterium sp.]|uniref:DUF222 domain-containing protein n=1 Tax=Microbacterium sp. TaxID=51671 RepID=UPI0039E49BAA
MEAVSEIERPADEAVLALFFEDVERHQYELNRDAARRAAALADALRFAREHPWVYAVPGDADGERTAERCAVIEAAARFQLSEAVVRTLAWVADAARERLPLLWARVWEGFATTAQAEAAVKLLARFGADAAGVAEFDGFLADLVLTATPGSFRRAAAKAARALVPGEPAVEHEAALRRRRVVHERCEDGMSWVHAYVDTVDAVAIMGQLRSEAKHTAKAVRDGRTRDQLRADSFVRRLRGATGPGRAGAVRTKVLVTVPLDRLAPEARASVRTDAAPRCGGLDLNAEPVVAGDGEPVDEATAVRLLLEAGEFTRVVTDPVSGVVLDVDRRSRKVTRAQREWLLLTHGTCTRDGCTRPAADAEIDHWDPFHGPGRGRTDIGNLHPFCESDHKTKDTTRLGYRRRPDGTVALHSPTGFTTSPDPVFLTTLQRLTRDRPVYNEPPF